MLDNAEDELGWKVGEFEGLVREVYEVLVVFETTEKTEEGCETHGGCY